MRIILSIILIAILYMVGVGNLSFAMMCHDQGNKQGSHEHAAQTKRHDHHIESSHNTEILGICPVIGGEASKDYSYMYEEKIYYFCCPGCIEEFKKEPQKYISKIKEIYLEAYQFGFSPEVIEVKKGDIIKIFATSSDVPHGVYIKEYNINVPIKKGQTQKIEFIAKKEGEFDILCSVYCGKGHNTMKGKLVVRE